MLKLTLENKIEVYIRRKLGETSTSIAKRFGINHSNIIYLTKLIDRHGYDVLKDNGNQIYSEKFKKLTIERVLINHEKIYYVSIDIGLLQDSVLHNWIKKFKKNRYNIIDNKRGRKPKTMRKIKIKKEPVIKDDKLKQLEEEIIYLKAENEY